MRRSLIIAAALALVISMAGAGLAVETSYEQGSEEEENPQCMAENSAIAPDPESEGSPIFEVPINLTLDNETVFRVCAGEHWDGQDPNTQNSDADTDADEDEGTVYINPLGDCSGWNSGKTHVDDGCSGGTDRPGGPQEGDLVHIRATADADDGSGDEAVGVTAAHNLEIWGAGRWAGGAHADNGDREGYVAIMLEDNSDVIFKDIAGDPLDHGDGNYLTIPFDPFLGGEAKEGDCTQTDYTRDDRDCRRDNNAWTIEFGYNWLPLSTSTHVETGPDPLP